MVNNYIESFNLNYSVTFPDINSDFFSPFTCEIINNLTDELINISELSSGEQLFLTLISLLINQRNEFNKKIDLLLLDEPDATLHPEMIVKLFNFIQNELVSHDTYVIITTHSPTTVALSSVNDIYEVNNKNDKPEDIIRRIDKDIALNNLLSGVPNLQVSTRNIRQVFVESDHDAYYYQKIFHRLQLLNKVSNDVLLTFVSSGSNPSASGGGNTGNCEQVKHFTSVLRVNHNNSVYGIIDWDSKNNDSGYLSCPLPIQFFLQLGTAHQLIP